MGDDGVGVAAVELLRRAVGSPEGVALLDGGTWGMQLLPEIEGASRLLAVVHGVQHQESARFLDLRQELHAPGAAVQQSHTVRRPNGAA